MAATRVKGPEPDFAELDLVQLRSTIYDRGHSFRVGTIGTVLFRHPGGEAFEVEFASPLPAVMTLRPWDLADVNVRP
ncbi:MAG: DUF4926 domain-containing protein [Sphingomonas sp.]